MRRFLYYLPGAAGISDERLVELGLIDRLPQRNQWAPFDGPDGGHGLLMRRGDALPRPKYAPENQTWAKAREGYWVGCCNAAVPRPSDLAREDFQPTESYSPTLSDGQAWKIPTFAGLPRFLGYDDNGDLMRKLAPRYRRMQPIADRLVAWYMGQRGYSEGKPTISLVDALKICTEIMALGYRVGQAEMELLGLPGEDDYPRIMALFIDAPQIDGLHAPEPEAADV